MRISDFAIVNDGSSVVTAALQAALDLAAGKTLHFDVDGTYLTGKLYVRSGTTLVMSPDVRFVKTANSTGLISLSNVAGVSIYANGARFEGADPVGTTAYGHTIYAVGAEDCLLDGLVVNGSSTGGGGKDCLYIGLGTLPTRNLRVENCTFIAGQRNCVSVVAGIATRITNCVASGAIGAPGAGIDVEANRYGDADGTLISRCRVFGNAKAGIASIFGSNTVIDDCDVYANGAYGCAVSSGGVQFNDGIYRPNIDMIGVQAFDPATGIITVGAQPPIGTPVNFSVRNGAVKPSELSASYYIVSRHIGTTGIVLGQSVRYAEVTAFASAGSGNLSGDPAVSDIRMRAFVEGQSDGFVVRNSRIYSNGAQGVFISGAGRALIDCNRIHDNGGNAVQINYARDVSVTRNAITGGLGVGISASTGGGRLLIDRNDVRRTKMRGISIYAWTGAKVTDNHVDDCALSDPSSADAGIHIGSGPRVCVARNCVSQPATNATMQYGIYAEAAASQLTVERNDCQSAGTSGANAIRVPAGTEMIGNVGW